MAEQIAAYVGGRQTERTQRADRDVRIVLAHAAALLEGRIKEYELQLKIYALALKRIYKRPVTRSCLHFLDSGRTENDTAKRRTIYEQLDARLDAVAPAIFASEVSGVFIGLNTFKLPPFEDDSKRFSAEEYGLQFRMIEMTK